MPSAPPIWTASPAWVLAALLAVGCAKDEPTGLASVDDHPDGYWQDTRFPQGTGILDGETRAEMERLANAGYADGYEPPPIQTGVTRWQPGKAEPGYNLYCSGHAPEAVLMDLDGTVLHRWGLPFAKVPSERVPEIRTQLTWRKVHLLPSGDLLACYEGLGLARVNAKSELIWYWDGGAHHDFEVEGETIVTLSRKSRYLSYLRNEKGFVEDALTTLDLETGKELDRISIYEALFQSRWQNEFMEAAVGGGDILHNNSVAPVGPVLAERLEGVAADDWILVFRNIDSIAILGRQSRQIVWMQRGPWKGPHAASALPSGNILLFDNMGHKGFTRLVEWDPGAQKTIREIPEKPSGAFVSIFSGNVKALPGGNWLASVSCAGFAQEFDPDGNVVWEFFSPHRAGSQNELVAVLFDVERLTPNTPLDWLKRGN